jgi:3'(2'), 5'-bisphosphate nucleotidase
MTDASNKLIDGVVDIAQKAGRAIMEVYESGDFDVETKDDNSPLTRADTAADKVIAEGLRALTPDVPILSEESASVDYKERKEWVQFWLVDPLDGTKEFIKKTDEFTVNIALIEQGVPSFGVVVAPALGVTYYGFTGGGSFKIDSSGNKKKIKVTTRDQAHKPRVVASVSHKGPILDTFLAQLGDHEIVNMGSSLKFCLVAEGSADIYPRLSPTMEWDTAAAQAVVECAGGDVVDLDGARLIYNKPDLHNPFFMVCSNAPTSGEA